MGDRLFELPGEEAVEVPEHRAQHVAGILSQYAFGEKPSKAQRAEAEKVAREALDRLSRFGS